MISSRYPDMPSVRAKLGAEIVALVLRDQAPAILASDLARSAWRGRDVERSLAYDSLCALIRSGAALGSGNEHAK